MIARPTWVAPDHGGGQQHPIGWLPSGPTDLTLQHPKLVAQRQHFSTELSVAALTDDQDLDQDSEQVVEEAVEHDRRSIAGSSRGANGSNAGLTPGRHPGQS